MFVYGKTSIALDSGYSKQQIRGSHYGQSDVMDKEENEEVIMEEPQDEDKYDSDEEQNLV